MQNLTTLIQNHIQAQGGRIRFEDYMQLALYAPGHGYYSSGTQKFGRHGDFITAPEIGQQFAKCIATQCRQIFAHLPQKNILEIGAGSGQLAKDLIAELGADLNQYYILELSAELQQRQLAKAPRVQWLTALPQDFVGIIIANEVMDAMPVTRFHFDQNTLQEYYVNANFNYELQTPSPALSNYFAQAQLVKYLSDNYSSEVNLWLPGWIKSLSAAVQHGVILLCDYGFPRAEYYHPQRNTGTLMCHYQHRCHDDPFYLPGQQDITAHVDFTAVAEAACANDLELGGFTNLASFLVNCGLINEHADQDIQIPGKHCVLPGMTHNGMTRTGMTQEINMLTSPAEMGELFKVLALTKNFAAELMGFTTFDRTHTL